MEILSIASIALLLILRLKPYLYLDGTPTYVSEETLSITLIEALLIPHLRSYTSEGSDSRYTSSLEFEEGDRGPVGGWGEVSL